MKIHIVQTGDTLWNLSKKYHVGFDELKAANSHLANPELVMPGMKIKIPTNKKQVSKKELKAVPEEKLMTPFKQTPIKAQPVVKEDDVVPKKKIEKKMPFPKLPPISLQMPKLPSIHTTQYNLDIDIDIDDNDTTIINTHNETHLPAIETKPADLPQPTEEDSPPEQLPAQTLPYGCMWVPMMPCTMPIYPTQQYYYPPMDLCQTYQNPSAFCHNQSPIQQAYYQPDNRQNTQGPKWGQLDVKDTMNDDLTDNKTQDNQQIQNYYHQMNQAWSVPNQPYPYSYPTYNAVNYPANYDHRNQTDENEDN